MPMPACAPCWPAQGDPIDVLPLPTARRLMRGWGGDIALGDDEEKIPQWERDKPLIPAHEPDPVGRQKKAPTHPRHRHLPQA
jgi:hypothetical protein